MGNGVVTYQSNDNSVATVNEKGEVTVVGVGETTITATAAETKNYKLGTASYTLTVNKARVLKNIQIPMKYLTLWALLCILFVQEEPPKKPSKIIFGYLQYEQLPEYQIPWDQLTHLSIAFGRATEEGGLADAANIEKLLPIFREGQKERGESSVIRRWRRRRGSADRIQSRCAG